MTNKLRNKILGEVFGEEFNEETKIKCQTRFYRMQTYKDQLEEILYFLYFFYFLFINSYHIHITRYKLKIYKNRNNT